MVISSKIKTTLLQFCYIILLCFSIKLCAQPISEKTLIAKMQEVYKQQNIKNLDSLYDTMKKQALKLGSDSLYIELTFQQIEKNGGVLLYPNSEIMLGNLLIDENVYLKKHPKLLLRCVHDLAQFYNIRSGSSEVIKEISMHFYRRYFKLVKKIDLTPKELKSVKLNKLWHLVYTKNDSIFYYLEQAKINPKEESMLLNHWYRELDDPKKELFYAKILEDKIKILKALINNLQFEEVERLYPMYLKELNTVDPVSEHELYMLMGQMYFKQKYYDKAEVMYSKALSFFEQKKSYLNTNVIYQNLMNIELKKGNLEGYSHYSKKLTDQNNYHEEQLLNVLKNHLDYHSEVADIEVELILSEEHLKNEMLSAKIKTQKTIISFALAFIIVTLIFVYFYSVNSKTKAQLEDANKQMVIDVLRSKFKPHFTFNVLSVINYFVVKEELQNATLALTKMSSLLRSTLDNMNEKLVPFLSEYKICENYMYLESLRFSDKFDYEFEPIKNVSIEQWMIPPGIIEPFLENAVNHAFTGVKYKGKIMLRHKIKDDKLIITIKDNGTGIKFVPKKNRKKHGLKITKDYIATVSKLYRSSIDLKISSIKGTTVEISIPKLIPYILS